MLDMESSHDTLESLPQERKPIAPRNILLVADQARQTMVKREAMELLPSLNPAVHPGLLKVQSHLQQNSSKMPLEMDWESPSELMNSALHGSSKADTFGGCIPQLSVKKERGIFKRDENCSAGHLDHRDHTYACLAQAKSTQESHLETTSMPTRWWLPQRADLGRVELNPQGILTASNVSGSSHFKECASVSPFINIFKYLLPFFRWMEG